MPTHWRRSIHTRRSIFSISKWPDINGRAVPEHHQWATSQKGGEVDEMHSIREQTYIAVTTSCRIWGRSRISTWRRRKRMPFDVCLTAISAERPPPKRRPKPRKVDLCGHGRCAQPIHPPIRTSYQTRQPIGCQANLAERGVAPSSSKVGGDGGSPFVRSPIRARASSAKNVSP